MPGVGVLGLGDQISVKAWQSQENKRTRSLEAQTEFQILPRKRAKTGM